MEVLFYILLNNIVPLSVMITLGVVLQKCFQLDIKTLSKLNFYLFSPAIVFKMLYESKITAADFFKVLLFFCIYLFALLIVVEIINRIRQYAAGMRSAMRNSIIFYNSANYAIPLNQLVFKNDPTAVSIQLIIMIFQNILPNTYGVYSVNAHKQQFRKTLRTILSLPSIYVIPLAMVLRGLNVEVPEPLYIPINYIAAAFIATALVTLGVQLGTMKWKIQFSDVLLSNMIRLCAGPVLGAVVLAGMYLFTDVDTIVMQALILSCAVPTSLSSVLLAVEFENEPEFASQAVFTSTLFSIVTVTAVIFLLRLIG
jgi:predicted permease